MRKKNQSRSIRQKWTTQSRLNKEAKRHVTLLANTCQLTGSKSERSSEQGQAIQRLSADEIRYQKQKESCQLKILFPCLWEDITPTVESPVHLTGLSTVGSLPGIEGNEGVPLGLSPRQTTEYVLAYSTHKRKTLWQLQHG